jgi:hypothetical protein
MALSVIPINCTLKRKGGEASSTDKMIGVLANHFAKQDVRVSDTLRMADYDILPGVTSDEGEGDDWPKLREQILAHDILIFGTPVWMGQLSSIGKRVCERMDAFLSETDGKGRMPSYGKVAVVAVVCNEDGAHNISAQLYQAGCRLDDPAERDLLLGRRGDGRCRLQGSQANAEEGDRNRADARGRRGASRGAAQGQSLSRHDLGDGA